MQNNKTVPVVASLVLAGSLAALWFANVGLPPRLAPRIHEEIGEALAQEALQLLRPGGHVAIISRDTATFPQPALDVTLGACLKTLRHGGVPTPEVHTLQVDALRPALVPSGDFSEWIRRAAEGDVLVSLLGPPLLTEEQQAALGRIKPRVVAFCPGYQPDEATLRRLVEQHLLHAAVLSRPPASIPALNRTTPGGETFANQYVRVHATEPTGWSETGGKP